MFNTIGFKLKDQSSHTFSRSLLDPIPDPAGVGGHASASSGVCHWPASQERQRGGVEGHPPLSDWYWWVIKTEYLMSWVYVVQLGKHANTDNLLQIKLPATHLHVCVCLYV